MPYPSGQLLDVHSEMALLDFRGVKDLSVIRMLREKLLRLCVLMLCGSGADKIHKHV